MSILSKTDYYFVLYKVYRNLGLNVKKVWKKFYRIGFDKRDLLTFEIMFKRELKRGVVLIAWFWGVVASALMWCILNHIYCYRKDKEYKEGIQLFIFRFKLRVGLFLYRLKSLKINFSVRW